MSELAEQAKPVGQPPKGTPPPTTLPDPEPLPPWALRRPLLSVWYIASRAGDLGRVTPFRRLTHITHFIYLGGQISLRGWQTLEKWGVRAIVNLRIEWDDRLLGIDTPHYLWLPTIDGTPSSLEQLARGAKFIHEQTLANRPIYVHCAAGVGRSVTQVIAYLMTRGMSSEAATDFVAKRRPFIALSDWQQGRLRQFGDYIAEQHIDYSRDVYFDPAQPAQQSNVDVPSLGKDS